MAPLAYFPALFQHLKPRATIPTRTSNLPAIPIPKVRVLACHLRHRNILLILRTHLHMFQTLKYTNRPLILPQHNIMHIQSPPHPVIFLTRLPLLILPIHPRPPKTKTSMHRCSPLLLPALLFRNPITHNPTITLHTTQSHLPLGNNIL